MRDRLNVTGFVLWLVATVILGTILVAWMIYPMEISWLRIQNRTGLTPAVIQKNFQILMQYLTSPFTWKLEMPDFPSSPDGLHHFQAVKYLFHLTQTLFLVLLPVAIRFIRTVMRKGYAGLYRRLFGGMVLLPIVIGGVTLFIGFDQFFTLFHQVLFVGDATWIPKRIWEAFQGWFASISWSWSLSASFQPLSLPSLCLDGMDWRWQRSRSM